MLFCVLNGFSYFGNISLIWRSFWLSTLMRFAEVYCRFGHVIFDASLFVLFVYFFSLLFLVSRIPLGSSSPPQCSAMNECSRLRHIALCSCCSHCIVALVLALGNLQCNQMRFFITCSTHKSAFLSSLALFALYVT